MRDPRGMRPGAPPAATLAALGYVPRPVTAGASPLRAEISALVRLAVPLAVAQGGQALMGVVDTAVVGRAGALPLAGVGLGNALFMALAVFGMGVMHGLDPLVAQALGAGDAARARRLLWQGTWLALALSAALALPFALAPAALEPLGIGARRRARGRPATSCGGSPGSRSSCSTSPAAPICRRTGSPGRWSSRRWSRTC